MLCIIIRIIIQSIIKLSILHTVEIARFFRKKGNKQKYSYSLTLKVCAQYSLLVDITHYWLFKFLVEVKFLVGRQISSRSLVSVNCKHASEEIYPVLLKQQSIKSSTTKSRSKLCHYLQSARKSAS